MDKKAKRALLKAVKAVGFGGFIAVLGLRHRIDEVCAYELVDGSGGWKNLVYHTGAEGVVDKVEVALEIERGRFRVWSEIPDLRGKLVHHPHVLMIQGYTARPVEYRQKAKMTVTNKNGTEVLDLVYSVYEDRRRGMSFALEDWGEGIYVYISQGHLAPEEVQVW